MQHEYNFKKMFRKNILREMKDLLFSIAIVTFTTSILQSQTSDSLATQKSDEKNALKFSINSSGSHYIQAIFLSQIWLRHNESNPGTTQFSKNAPSTFDIGLRRTRVQLLGQITDRTFMYFQFGQNNFNSAYNFSGNRKLAAFFHDVVGEFKVSKKDEMKIGAGLTIMNGLSRFSQPSVGTIMSMDVPVFLQYSVDQIDQFDRRLAIYARGQLSKLDYRIYMANPFPISSNGTTPPAIGMAATFVNPLATYNGKGTGIHNQFGGYLVWNFFENEPHTTPYMAGTYLGNKKIVNIASGIVFQKNATWRLSNVANSVALDTVYDNMLHLSFETFIDLPLNAVKKTAFNFFTGYYSTSYGKNYLRYNGIMNPATGSMATNLIQANAYGNSFPMFGTGQVIYSQIGFLLSNKLLGEKNGQLMPYITAQYADYFALQNKTMLIIDGGINWFIKGHQSKLALNFQNRPTYFLTNSTVEIGKRKNGLILQYQLSF